MHIWRLESVRLSISELVLDSAEFYLLGTGCLQEVLVEATTSPVDANITPVCRGFKSNKTIICYRLQFDSDSPAFDNQSWSLTKLNNSITLYLWEVNRFLDLVCILREDNKVCWVLDFMYVADPARDKGCDATHYEGTVCIVCQPPRRRSRRQLPVWCISFRRPHWILREPWRPDFQVSHFHNMMCLQDICLKLGYDCVYFVEFNSIL